MVLRRASGGRGHRQVADLPGLLEPGSLLVFNNSQVLKARLTGIAEASGKPVAFLLIRRLDTHTWEVMTGRSKRRRSGSRYCFAGGVQGVIAGEEPRGGFRRLCFSEPVDGHWLNRHGRVPLPPYIKRQDTLEDGERYQTIYASVPGSAAAPTAGLHFTTELLDRLGQAGMETLFITLHVGPGTFLPVRTERLEEHRMHEEAYAIDGATAQRIERAKAEGRKIVAVGTTSLRALESAWLDGEGRLQRGARRSSLFIYPGYTFRVADALFTNFHTPRSTLLMLVSAFAGREYILESYAEAVCRGYRFFSYGDAMLIQ
jgi:S-adenosylmethionine:tRNA ribosyltransferase-isomerase